MSAKQNASTLEAKAEQEVKVMKAAVINEFNQELEIKEIPVPELAYGEILVKIKACGVCHTDLHAAHG